jgi:hypothetical protein
VHYIVPNQREWLFVLACVNESGEAILAFYIFQEKRFCKNYIEHCEAGATMAMQPHAWMTSYLFSAWISHFLESVRKLGGISPEHCHRFILDGHNSHVTLEVVMEAKRVGLDLLTLPSHTSHALQPLDVSNLLNNIFGSIGISGRHATSTNQLQSRHLHSGWRCH